MRIFSLFFAAGVLAVVVSACQSADSDAKACRGIPANGCPLNETQSACDDRSCAAIYLCEADGSWSLQQTCPNYVPPADAGATDASDAAPLDAGPTKFPYPIPPGAYGGANCIDLQEPDCSVGTVVGCADAVDTCCGCETLFVCQGGEWIPWGQCEADGGIVVGQ